MTPSSSQTLHCHRIGAPGSVRSTIIRPRQRRLAGRRRHGSALSQLVAASPAVAARTMLLRCSASRRAGPGVSAGRSRKWCRSVTNISQDCTGPRSHAVRHSARLAVAPFSVRASKQTWHRNRRTAPPGRVWNGPSARPPRSPDYRHTDGARDRHRQVRMPVSLYDESPCNGSHLE